MDRKKSYLTQTVSNRMLNVDREKVADLKRLGSNAADGLSDRNQLPVDLTRLGSNAVQKS